MAVRGLMSQVDSHAPDLCLGHHIILLIERHTGMQLYVTIFGKTGWLVRKTKIVLLLCYFYVE